MEQIYQGLEATKNIVKKITNVVNSTMEGSSLSDTKYGVTGISATTAETNDVLSKVPKSFY